MEDGARHPVFSRNYSRFCSALRFSMSRVARCRRSSRSVMKTYGRQPRFNAGQVHPPKTKRIAQESPK